MKKILAAVLVFALSASANAGLITSSFTGDFNDNDARYYVSFDVTVDNTNVNLVTWSYAGGVNSAGTVIADGGFDTQLFLFDSAGELITENDDGSSAISTSSSNSYDSLISRVLNIGSYTAVLTQYDSDFVSGDIFTGEWSNSGADDYEGRNSNYAVDISGNDLANIRGLGVNATSDVSVPEPASMALFGTAIFGLMVRRRIKK